ncbi:MAG: hypothetical protein ABIH39_07350 [Candidatus Margulisiibacteriota bacterium]
MQSSIPNFSKIFQVSFFDFIKVQFQAIGSLIAFVLLLMFIMLLQYFGWGTPMGYITLLIGITLISIVILLTATGVSRMIKADLLNESPISSREAMEFLKQNALSIIATPFLLILFIALVLGVEALLSLIGFIPVLGPLVLAIFTIPAVIVNVVLAIIFIVGSKLISPIIAIEETGIIDTLNLAYRTCKDEPLKVAFYTGMLTIVGVGVFILPVLVYILGLFLTSAFHWSMQLNCFYSIYYSWGIMQFLFFFITGASVLVMTSLVIALPLTYIQGMYTYIYLSFKNKF